MWSTSGLAFAGLFCAESILFFDLGLACDVGPALDGLLMGFAGDDSVFLDLVGASFCSVDPELSTV